VRVAEQDAHGLGDLVVGDHDHVLGLAPEDVERSGRRAARHAVGQPGADGRLDRLAGKERIEVGGGMRRHHADQPLRAPMWARAAAAAQKPEPWPMGTNTTSGGAARSCRRTRPVGRHAAHELAVERGHHVQALLAPASSARVRGRLEVVAVLDQLTPSARMAAFFSVELPCGTTMVAGQPVQPRREADRLAVVAARGADDAAHFGLLARQRSK
jgi:hypothetical protein